MLVGSSRSYLIVAVVLRMVCMMQVQGLSYLVQAMGNDAFSKRYRKLSQGLCEVTTCEVLSCWPVPDIRSDIECDQTPSSASHYSRTGSNFANCLHAWLDQDYMLAFPLTLVLHSLNRRTVWFCLKCHAAFLALCFCAGGRGLWSAPLHPTSHRR